ncbi:unnamed protein product [Brassica oleracea var. botrytis]
MHSRIVPLLLLRAVVLALVWLSLVLFVWLPQVSASATALMRTVVVRFADADAAAAAYYIATADFIGVSRRTRRSDAASDTVSCVNETNKN